MEQIEREAMEFDVVIVGGGPAGLSAAIKLRQLAIANDMPDLSVCLVEKGSEIGAHILSGAILRPRALDELIPDWKEKGAPLNVETVEDHIIQLLSPTRKVRIPDAIVPKTMHNHGNYIVSLGNVCRWLAEQAEALEVTIFPGFAAAEMLYNEDGSVKGVVTGDMGVAKDGAHKHSFTAGYELHAKYTILAEGCRGSLGKQLIKKFDLEKDSDPQHYGIGIKEIWEIDPALHKPGVVLHGSGWPLSETGTAGGWFMYFAEHNQVYLGLIIDLSYKNCYMSPFDEMQRWKTHPEISQYLVGGKRISYGARALVKGGLNSLPKLTMPGACLIGDDAGFLNYSKIKGSHTAMKSGMLCAEAVFEALQAGRSSDDVTAYTEKFEKSWLYEELYKSRNFGAAMHRMGTIFGGGFNFVEQNIFGGRMPYNIHDTIPDYKCLDTTVFSYKPDYPKPDGKLTFDKLSSVFMSNTNHAEDQPIHLKLTDPSIPIKKNLPTYAEPAQRYCPAGVYEVVSTAEGAVFQINSQNCVHCKTCDIKDPAQNITWTTPEGGGGPNYPNM